MSRRMDIDPPKGGNKTETIEKQAIASENKRKPKKKSTLDFVVLSLALVSIPFWLLVKPILIHVLLSLGRQSSNTTQHNTTTQVD